MNVKMSTGMVSPEAPPWLIDGCLLHESSHAHLSLLVARFTLISSPAVSDQGPHEQPHGNLITSLKALSPNIDTSYGSRE